MNWQIILHDLLQYFTFLIWKLVGHSLKVGTVLLLTIIGYYIGPLSDYHHILQEALLQRCQCCPM